MNFFCKESRRNINQQRRRVQVERKKYSKIKPHEEVRNSHGGEAESLYSAEDRSPSLFKATHSTSISRSRAAIFAPRLRRYETTLCARRHPTGVGGDESVLLLSEVVARASMPPYRRARYTKAPPRLSAGPAGGWPMHDASKRTASARACKSCRITRPVCGRLAR